MVSFPAPVPARRLSTKYLEDKPYCSFPIGGTGWWKEQKKPGDEPGLWRWQGGKNATAKSHASLPCYQLKVLKLA